MITMNSSDQLSLHKVPFSAHLNLTSVKNFKKMKRILMIEDDPEMAELITRSLKNKFSCATYIANDPFEAMNLMSENFYDLIILDWQLPGLNGYETLQHADKSLSLEPSLPIQWDHKKVPVVIVSASKRKDCNLRQTDHFNYVGYVSKLQPLKTIVDCIGDFIDDERNFKYKLA